MVDVAICHIWRGSGDVNEKILKSGLWQYSVRDGGDVVVVDDDDGEGVIIIKQMVMLVQAFAGFLLFMW